MLRKVYMLLFIAFSTVFSQEEVIGAKDTSKESTKSLNITDPIINAQQALPVITKGNRKAITGTVLFASAVGLEYLVINPWSARVLNKTKRAKTYNDSMEILTESLSLLAGTVPVQAMRIIGPTLACIGASRVYVTYRDGINSNAPDIYVWKPYIAGWVLAGGSGLMGVIGSLSKKDNITTVSSVLGIGSDIMWGWASIWSLIYSSQRKSEVINQKLSVGISGNGLTLNYRF